MFYALIENGSVSEYPLHEGTIKSRFPNTVFPSPFEAPDGFVVVKTSEPPQVDYTQNIKEGTPELIDGEWTQQWIIEDASNEEITLRVNSQSQSARLQRNTLLSECDWTQLTDAPVDGASWGAYRSALRDIPLQEGFPFDIDWPHPPT